MTREADRDDGGGGESGGPARGVVDPELDLDSDEPQEAVVVFADGDDVERLDDLPDVDYYAFEALPMAYARLDGEGLREVAGWESVRQISANRDVEFHGR